MRILAALIHRFRPPALVWVSSDHDDEPRDQETDLHGPFWAGVGPDSRRTPDGWSWSVMDFDRDNDTVAVGFVNDEAAAKDAVRQWAAQNRRTR